MNDPEAFCFSGDDRFPNSALPVLVYWGALAADPAAMEQAFAAQGWTNSWRNGVFDYHHYHSITHEVLGIASGEVTVRFGGPAGQDVTVRAGDVVVIPAGVSHRNMGDRDLLTVGAYPGGSECDVLRGDPAELAAAQRAIAAIPLPDHDPVPGQACLRRLWNAA